MIGKNWERKRRDHSYGQDGSGSWLRSVVWWSMMIRP